MFSIQAGVINFGNWVLAKQLGNFFNLFIGVDKDNLEELHQEILELQKQDLDVNEKLREQREELESKKELYVAQSRCIKDEISTIKGEIRERRSRVEKLKVKFSLIVKALGDTGKSDEEIEKALPSHAFHLVKLAQEKAEKTEYKSMCATYRKSIVTGM